MAGKLVLFMPPPPCYLLYLITNPPFS
uniref:Uncharacterized protein n=1 Tax=Arundo donax TaxID=35708 RepID=A0A0A9DSG5_ARUDO